MRLQEAMAEAVDRGDPGGVELAREIGAAGLGEARANAAAELAGGALGVGDDEERVDVEAALAHRLHEALDEHRRLARPGAGGDEDDAGRLDRGALLGIRGAHAHAHALLTRHIGASSHQEGHAPSPSGS
jgi:hypothetical protein